MARMTKEYDPERDGPKRPIPGKPGRPMPLPKPMPGKPGRPMPSKPGGRPGEKPVPGRPMPGRPGRPMPDFIKPMPGKPGKPGRPMPSKPGGRPGPIESPDSAAKAEAIAAMVNRMRKNKGRS